jgi:sarcosine oxidase
MSRAPRPDVVVVGCGAMGAAACFHCARAGARVLGLERHGVPNARGSSHGGSRVIRQAYFEHPDYVPLLRRSYELFAELEQAVGTTLFLRCGALFLGRRCSEVVDGSLRAARLHEVPHELLTPADLRSRLPQFHVPEDHVALFEPGAGCVRPEATIRAHALRAESLGAEIRSGVRVLAIESRADGAVVRWADERTPSVIETIETDRVVVAGGPWTTELLGARVPPLRVTRQPIVWVSPEPDAVESHRLGPLPVWLVDRHDGTAVYGIPHDDRLEGPVGMKIAIHGGGEAMDPETQSRTATSGEVDVAVEATRGVLPRSVARVEAASICLYTYSPDGHFVIDHADGHGRIAVACGFSGHGFKFAPVVGEVLADLALRGATALPVGFLAASRFDRGR